MARSIHDEIEDLREAMRFFGPDSAEFRRRLDRLLAEYDALEERLERKNPRVLIQEMLSGGCEVIVGARANEGVGPTVMFGLGGIFVEVMKDVAFAVAPLSRPEARELIELIKGYKVLTGVRGEPSVDLAATEDLVLRVARLVADFPQIAEMDLNPIFLYPEGIHGGMA